MIIEQLYCKFSTIQVIRITIIKVVRCGESVVELILNLCILLEVVRQYQALPQMWNVNIKQFSLKEKV